MATFVVKDRVAQNVGTVSALNTPVVFGLPDMSQTYTGLVTVVGNGGAATGPTWVLEGSIDGGSTWFVIPAQSTLPIAITGQMTGDTAPLFANQYNVAGLGGALFHFGLSAGTGLTATTVWVLVG
jgi:hypothetical protein